MGNIIVSDMLAADPGVAFKLDLHQVGSLTANKDLGVELQVVDATANSSVHNTFMTMKNSSSDPININEVMVIVLPFASQNYTADNLLNVTVNVKQDGTHLAGSPYVKNGLSAQGGKITFTVS